MAGDRPGHPFGGVQEGLVRFACAGCGAKIKAPAGAAGRRGKCPKCAALFTVPGAPRKRPSAPAGAGLLDKLAAVEAAARPLVAGGAAAASCTACGAQLAAGAVLCTRRGHDLRSGRRVTAAGPAPAGERGPVVPFNPLRSGLVRGCPASTICVAAAGALWALIAIKTEYEIGYVAWAMGGLAGLAMYATRQEAGFLSGALAAGITLAGVVVVRWIILSSLAPGNEFALTGLLAPSQLGLGFVALAVGTAFWVGSRGPSQG